MPKEIFTHIDTTFKEYKLESASLSNSPKNDFYDIEIQKSDKNYELTFDLTGKLLKIDTLDKK